jgi:putative transposase
MRYYQRRLPHFDVVGQPLFVTFRLYDSLPANRVFLAEALTSGKAFVEMDRMLDQAQTGPRHLSMPDIASMVVEAIHDGERRFGRYQLHSFVVMPNHVHLLVTPSVPSAKWLRTLKGLTAHEANAILGRTGNPFWQSESYDHLVRPGNSIASGDTLRIIRSRPGWWLRRTISYGQVREPAGSRLPAK